MRVVVAEKDAAQREHLVGLLQNLGCQVLGAVEEESDNIDQLFHEAEICFFSLSIAPSLGMQFLRQLPRHIPTVLISGRTELAFEAFEMGVWDFIKPPIERERLATCLLRISEVTRHTLPIRIPTRRNLRFPAKVGDGTLMIDLNKTTHFTFEDHVVWAHASGRFHTYWRSLTEVEEAFPHSGFFRAQRNVLLALDQIIGLRAFDQGRIQARLQGGVELEVTRGASPRLKERLGIP